MTRKAATRGRKEAGRSAKSTERAADKTASRATSRTGKKTASARATHSTARAALAQRGTPVRKAGVRAPDHAVKLDEGRTDQIRAVHAEDDEDLDWLNEDEDPRSQIVEDDDDWDPHQKEEW